MRGTNRQPYAEDTTVEFRLHRETKNPERVVGWVKLLVAMVEFAKCATWDEFFKVIYSSWSEARILARIGGKETKLWLAKRLRIYRRLVKLGDRRISYAPASGYRWARQVIVQRGEKTGQVKSRPNVPVERDESCAA